jgi:hypothetical protein
MLRVWWCALHALLAAAVALIGVPVIVKALAFLALLCHAAVRRPCASPRVLHVAADGSCAVPEWRTGNCGLGPRTLLCPFWLRLDLGRGFRQRYIFLFADQVAPHEWRRVRALLRRASSE